MTGAGEGRIGGCGEAVTGAISSTAYVMLHLIARGTAGRGFHGSEKGASRQREREAPRAESVWRNLRGKSRYRRD